MEPKRLYVNLLAVAVMGLTVIEMAAIPGEMQMDGTFRTKKFTNRLIDENSPYLLQHAHNPVDWYPWGPEAFIRARSEDKPIFLSIGYSTCHWCHVMERESFENEQIAKIMNDHFVCIKVDREQRPDIDEIYMNAVVMTTGSGGWPLSVFLTPEGKPFFGGTYFPPEDIYGHPGFSRVLLSVADAWKNRRPELLESAGRLSEFLKNSGSGERTKSLTPQTLDKAFDRFREMFDTENGGFGTAPKFPQPDNLSMLLCYWHRTNDIQALQMVEKTLEAMADGGIYDHIGGGFHRYATDARWLVPHFEKMLYDQALLSKVYLQAWQITGNSRYADIAKEIFDYVLRDMTDPEGGFYSAEDADSEGEEGTFYLWDRGQIESILGKDKALLFNACYGVTDRGNFEKSKTILNVTKSVSELQRDFQMDRAKVVATLESARAGLFEERSKRIRPHLDDKVITAWNGLMISSLACGGAVLEEPRYIEAAQRAAQFVLDKLYSNGRLMRYYRDGRVVGYGFLDDYAFVTMALEDLYEATFDARWLVEANKLAEEMVKLFADDDGGGYFLTGKDGEKLIARTRPGSDGAIPSGNSVAAIAMLKLGRLTGNQTFTSQGVRILEAFSAQLGSSPVYSTAMLTALDFYLGPTQEIVIAGKSNAADTKRMLKSVRGKFLPRAVVLLNDPDDASSTVYEIVPFIKNQTASKGRATAYVCENYVCNKPVHSACELENLLASTEGKSRSDIRTADE